MNQTLLSAFARWQSTLRLAVELVLAVTIALLIARVFWLVLAPEDSVSNAMDRPLPSPYTGIVSNLAVTADRTILISDNPFAQNDVEDLVLEDAPQTNLNLQLLGVFASASPDLGGTAFIKTPDNLTKRYGANDEIIAGVTLQRVLSDRVIIDRDGASETLMLGGRGSGLSVIGDESQVIPPTRQPNGSPSVSVDPSLPPISGQAIGPEVLYTSMSISPATTEDGVSGYRVSSRGNVEEMRRAGFEPGDILLQINGTPIADVDTEELLERFDDAETAIIRIDRDGIQRTIRLELGE